MVRRLNANACQPSTLTRPRRARLAGAGAARVRGEFMMRMMYESEGCMRQVSFLPNNNQK